MCANAHMYTECCTYANAYMQCTRTHRLHANACMQRAEYSMCVRTSARALGAQCLRALARCACAHKHAAHRQTPRACMLPLLSLTQRFRHFGSSAGPCLTHRPTSPARCALAFVQKASAESTTHFLPPPTLFLLLRSCLAHLAAMASNSSNSSFFLHPQRL